MLVTIENVTLTAPFVEGMSQGVPTGRVTGALTADTEDGPAISNENVAIGLTQYASNQTFTSVTGIVTWFFSYHVAPRTLDDLKTQ